MKKLGIYTKNFSLYHDIIEALNSRNLHYVSLSSIDNIPNSIGVIITSNNEIHDIKLKKTIAADAYDNINHAIDLAQQLLIGKDLYSKLYIGIDPGENSGIAIVGDDVLLHKTNILSPEEVHIMVKRFLREFPAMETIIRIGHGSRIIRNRIINSLIKLKTPIEIVDETKTTSSKSLSRLEKDSEAAALIALISGEKVKRNFPLKPTKGDIRNIQQQSRKLTNGRYSISEKTAIDVLRGNIDLIKAVEIEKSDKKPKHL